MSMATTRQASEVQAAMIVAKNFPRDETTAIGRLKTACKRKGLAECSIYSYPKGGQQIQGPSIRLAEAMAQAWGNIDYGVIVLSQNAAESSVMAYAWDLETNTRRQMVFQVQHIRATRQGTSILTDPRDVYEMVANQGARRLRACILGVIPGDVQDLAVAECEKTLKDDSGKPLADRIRDMVIAFSELGVTKEMLEARLQHPVTACTAQNVVSFTKIFLSIRDGISKREDWFDLNAGAAPAEPAEKPASRTEAAAAKGKRPDPPAAAEPDKEKKPPAKPSKDSALPFDVQITKAETLEQLEAIYEAMGKANLPQEEYSMYHNMLTKKQTKLQG